MSDRETLHYLFIYLNTPLATKPFPNCMTDLLDFNNYSVII